MRNILLALLFILCVHCYCAGQELTMAGDKSCGISLKEAALQHVTDLTQSLGQSSYFPGVSPELFVIQLKERIRDPYGLNQGKTYFCWIAAPLAHLFDKEPINMADALVSLYTSGKFRYFNGHEYLCFGPTERSRKAIGTETFNSKNDALNGRLVDQMLFLTFADHYKCWINVDRHFDPGDQQKPAYAAATLNKEKRVWRDLHYSIDKHGFNLLWMNNDKASIAAKALQNQQTVVLFVNAACFNKKRSASILFIRKAPYIVTGTHYILLMKIDNNKGQYSICFWDDDGIQHDHTMSRRLFQRAVFGVIAATKPGDGTDNTICDAVTDEGYADVAGTAPSPAMQTSVSNPINR